MLNTCTAEQRDATLGVAISNHAGICISCAIASCSLEPMLRTRTACAVASSLRRYATSLVS
jgi:hypothetical protein